MTMARFCIVVPTFQADGWLDQTLNSIFSQAGRHAVRLHLQDGGSTDATLQIAERWQALTRPGSSPFSGRLTMSIESAADGGLYDAVSRGFESLDPEPSDLMTWLNADDLLAPGALASVASCLEELPDVSLCGGRVSMIDADGRVVRVNAPVALSRRLVAAGCHDGRRMPFVMQEGTFWRQDLWARVGGLNPSFRLAGDWDLWRRMATHAEFVTLDVLTAFHRRRPGQLSENLDAYYLEVDRMLAGSAREAYDHVYWSYIASGSKSGGQAFEGFEGPVAQLDRDSLTWSMTHRFGERLAPAVVQTPSGRASTLRGGVLSGAKGFEGPYPEWDLPGAIRWITERHARLTVPTPGPGRHLVRLTCRPGMSDLSVTIRAGEEVVLHAVLDPLTPVRDQLLSFELWTAGGETVLELETRTPHGDPENRLLVVDLTAEPLPPPMVLPPDRDGPLVAIVSDGQSQGLATSLAALTQQTPRPAVVVIAPESGAVHDAVVDEFRALVREQIISHDPATAVARGLQPDLVLEAGIRLAPGALAERQARAGAAVEIDGRALHWIRPPSSLGPGIVPAGTSGEAIDRPLQLGAPGDSLEPRPRILRLIAQGGSHADTLALALARMDAEVRVLSLPEGDASGLIAAELKTWRPAAVLGTEAALARLPQGAPPSIRQTPAVLSVAEAAARRLAIAPQSRAAARALFGLEAFTPVWAAAARDAAAARAEAGEDAVLLILGEGSVPARLEPAVRAGPVNSPEVLAWALSAADRFWAGGTAHPEWAEAARACGLVLAGRPPAETAPLDMLARAMLEAADVGAQDIVRRALRFRPAPSAAFGLYPGPGAEAADGSIGVADDGLAYLLTPAPGPVRLKLTAPRNVAEVVVRGAGFEQRVVMEAGRGRLVIDAPSAGMSALRISTPGARRARVVLALADSRPGGFDAAHAVPWEALHGFGREEASAPELGLDAAFRWVEGRSARLSVVNERAGWRRLTVRLRTLSAGQRVMIRAGGRTLVDAPLEGGDPKQVIPIEATAWLPEGRTEIDLRFLAAAVMPDRSLAAIVDGVELRDDDAPTVASAPWTDVDGYDFEEPPVPQYGLENAFRWRLAGSRIAVASDRPGRHQVTIRYRTALPGQSLTASVGDRVLARHTADAGRLDMDERLSFEVDLSGEPLEIALDADRYMEGDRPLGFIIQSVLVESAP